MQGKLGKQAKMLKDQESLIHDVEIVLASATEAIQRVNGVLPLRLSTPVAVSHVAVKAPGGQQTLGAAPRRKKAAPPMEVEKEAEMAVVAIEPTPGETLIEYTG